MKSGIESSLENELIGQKQMRTDSMNFASRRTND